jgi:hypothetical protein
MQWKVPNLPFLSTCNSGIFRKFLYLFETAAAVETADETPGGATAA